MTRQRKLNMSSRKAFDGEVFDKPANSSIFWRVW